MTRLAAAVAQAADQLRIANHETVRGSITATEAYDVVGNLDDLAHRLPQLLDYLTRSLRRADAPEYFDDRGTDPGQALTSPTATSTRPATAPPSWPNTSSTSITNSAISVGTPRRTEP